MHVYTCVYLHLYIPVYSCIQLCIPAYACVYTNTCVYLHIPVYTCIYLCLPVYTCIYLCIPVYTCINPCLPAYICVQTYLLWIPLCILCTYMPEYTVHRRICLCILYILHNANTESYMRCCSSNESWSIPCRCIVV